MSSRSSGSRSNSTLVANGFLDQPIDALDAEEFEIPNVEEQSLDEILQEDIGGDLLAGDPDIEIIENKFATPSDVGSEASSFRTNATGASYDWKHPPKQRRKSDMLRLDKLRGVSSQLQSASDRVNAGSPSTMAIFSSTNDDKTPLNLMAVGTTHGVLLVFDTPSQSLKFSLGASTSERSTVAGFGSVSALSFSHTGSRLLVGYSKGHLQLVDCQKGRVVITLQPEQAHQPGKGILHVAFTQLSSLAVCVDSGGSVFEVRFGSSITGLTSRLNCIFSGCHGEVCTINPLIVPDRLRQTCKHYCEPILLAMASLTKVMVVSLKSPTHVIFSSHLYGPPNSPPLVSWQWAPIQVTAKVRITDPVLTFCRGTQVAFYQLHTSDGEDWRSFCLKKHELPIEAISCGWLSQRCLIFVDSNETAHLYEVSSGNNWSVVENLDVSDCRLVYSSSDFKGLATGGSVSPALSYVADRTCYYSVTADGLSKTYILGLNGLFSISMRTWFERVESFESSDDFVGAIQLTLDFYSGKVKTGGTAMNRSDRWRDIIGEKAGELIVIYVKRALNQDKPRTTVTDVLQDHFKKVIPLCVDACTCLQRWDLLYDTIYEIFCANRQAKGLFLECLEDRLLDGNLPNIPPALIQDYLNHLAQESMLAAVESSIVRLPIDCLDLHQVMTLCRAHNLYDGIIYVNNRALKDYSTPLKEMIEKLKEAMFKSDLLSDEIIQLGNKILLYVRGQRLFQEYLCISFAKVENQRLKFIANNQKKLRSEKYGRLCEDVRSHEADKQQLLKSGVRVILPPSFMNSYRYFHDHFQKAMAIVREYHKPDLFITFTCNQNWPEILQSLLPGQKPEDRPDIIARVFNMKLKAFKDEITKDGILGRRAAIIDVREFQKRGLPHAHLLLIFPEEDRLHTADDVDDIICAEFPPDPNTLPEGPEKERVKKLEKLVLTHMVHTCKKDRCSEKGYCDKGFPKDYCEATEWDDNAFYPKYRRRDGRVVLDKNGQPVTNQRVVPYNPYLLLRFNCHINVEACVSPTAAKYLFNCCLCGRAYPIGALSSDDAQIVSADIYRFITKQSLSGASDLPSFPYLRLLLKFDTREFLNVLSMAFDSYLFSSESGFRCIQDLLDIMIEIVLGCDFSAVQMGAFLTFISRLAVQQKRWLQFDRERFHQLLKSALCAAEDTIGTSSFEERQQAILELLQAPIGQNLLDKRKILYWAEQGKYLQICENLYWQQREYHKIIECYLGDRYRQTEVFRLLHQMMSSTDILNTEKLAIKRNFVQNLPTVAKIDARQCAEVLLDHFSDNLSAVCDGFNDEKNIQLQLLAAIFRLRRSTGHRSVSKDSKTDRQLVDKYINLLCEFHSNEPDFILDFIKTWDHYCEENDFVLKVCREYKIHKAAVYLLEKRSAYDEAFQILIQALDELAESDIETFVCIANETLGFCHRFSTNTSNSERSRQFWFDLLDRLLNLPQNLIKTSTGVKDTIGQVVHAMITFVTPADVLERLFDHHTFKSCTYAEHQDLITNIIQGYDYQQVLLDKTVSAVHSDVHGFLADGFHNLARAFTISSKQLQCHACGDFFSDSDTLNRQATFMFACGHVFHVTCVKDPQPTDCPLCLANEKGEEIQIPSRSQATSLTTNNVRPTRPKQPLRTAQLLESLHELDNPFTSDDSNIFKSDKFPLRLAPIKKL